MEIIRDIAGYNTKRGDYEELWKLAQTQSVVCFVDHLEDCRDVCQTIFCGGVVSVSARGICYVEAHTSEKFVEKSAWANLEWLMPKGRLLAEICLIAATSSLPDGDTPCVPSLLWFEQWADKIEKLSPGITGVAKEEAEERLAEARDTMRAQYVAKGWR